jgi:hypothetical protein
MEAFDRCFFDGAVHPLDFTVGRRVVRCGQPMLDVICFADHVEAHLTRPSGVRLRGRSANWMPLSVRILWIRYGTALSRCSRNFHAVRLSPVDELAGAVDVDEQVKFALDSPNLGNIYVKEADQVVLEALSLKLVALDIWQTGYALPLQAAVQR